MIFCPFLFLFSLASAEIYFKDDFDQGFDDRWIYSEDTSVTHGVFSHHQLQHCSEGDFAIKSVNGSSYYHLSAPFAKPLDTKATPLHLQFLYQYSQTINCGGGYVKLFSTLNPKTLSGQSPYTIMVGPDVCGGATQVIHLILEHKGNNFPLKDAVSFSPDTDMHLIDLYIGTDKEFYLKFDDEVKVKGKLEDHFDYLPPKMINDPTDVKPDDWVDEPTMVDPEDKKPEDWDDKRDIPDPDAKKPEDWDDSADGEWEPDFIKNPNYKGDWTPKTIPNPAYKGKWEQKQIPNPDYVQDTSFGEHKHQWVGVDLWTVEHGLVFDEFLVTDDDSEAKAHRERVMAKIKEFNAKKQAEQPKQPEDSGKLPEVDDSEPIEPETDKDDDDEDHEDL